MEMAENTCAKCGNTNFREGELDGYARVRPVNSSFSRGSAILVQFCSKCGEIFSMTVTKPERFPDIFR